MARATSTWPTMKKGKKRRPKPDRLEDNAALKRIRAKRLAEVESEDPPEYKVKSGTKGWVRKVGGKDWKPYETSEDQTFDAYQESGTAVIFVRDGWQLMVRMKDASGIGL